VNRVHEGGRVGLHDADVSGDLEALLGEKLGRKVARNFDDHHRLADHDRAGIARLMRELGREPVIAVPLLDDDVHDLEGLAELDDYLFAGEFVQV
jgi:hypothetical protein